MTSFIVTSLRRRVKTTKFHSFDAEARANANHGRYRRMYLRVAMSM